MDKYISIICAVGGMAFGALGAFLTACISRRSLKNKTDNLVAVMGTNALRLVLDVVFLLAAYLVCRNYELPLLVTLISVALGLTVFGMLFLKRVVKKLTEEDDDPEADGGE